MRTFLFFTPWCLLFHQHNWHKKTIELIPPKNWDKTLLQSALIFSVRSSSLLNLKNTKNRRLFALVNDPTLRNYCKMKRFVCLYSEIFVSQVWVVFREIEIIVIWYGWVDFCRIPFYVWYVIGILNWKFCHWLIRILEAKIHWRLHNFKNF